jgi:hypothetical protein
MNAHRAGAAVCRAIIAFSRGHHAAAWLYLFDALPELEAQERVVQAMGGDGPFRDFFSSDSQTNILGSLETFRAWAGSLRLHHAGEKLNVEWVRCYNLHREDHEYLATSRLCVSETALAERLRRFLPDEEQLIPFPCEHKQ